LSGKGGCGIFAFVPEPNSMLPAPPARPTVGPEEGDPDFQSPQREAAFFFGLFLRGHSADELRRDIDFPQKLMTKWQRRHDPQAPSKEELEKLYDFRKRVLAIFNFLVSSETGRTM
jgi:hypothetical protein